MNTGAWSQSLATPASHLLEAESNFYSLSIDYKLLDLIDGNIFFNFNDKDNVWY